MARTPGRLFPTDLDERTRAGEVISPARVHLPGDRGDGRAGAVPLGQLCWNELLAVPNSMPAVNTWVCSAESRYCAPSAVMVVARLLMVRSVASPPKVAPAKLSWNSETRVPAGVRAVCVTRPGYW